MTDETHECPTCGDAFKTEGGMKVHHSQIHGEEIGKTAIECDFCGEEKTFHDAKAESRKYCSDECQTKGQAQPMMKRRCSNCGEIFEIKPYRVAEGEGQFCSSECDDEWRRNGGAPTGENHPRWGGGPPKATCEWCGDEFEGHQGNPNRFCGSECEAEWRSEEFSGEGHPLWEDKDMSECEWCGSDFRPRKGNPNRFCSNVCKAEFQSSPEGWTYKGGPKKYGRGWNDSKKREVRERDGHQCRSCGMSQGEHLNEYGMRLHVHHIKPAREVESAEERNATENLTTLCIPCHNKYEGLPVVPRTAN